MPLSPARPASFPGTRPSGLSGVEPLLGSRSVVPDPPTDLVVRPALVRMLEDGVRRPLTLVCAPAGTGKTVLAAAWAARRQAATPAWITLDEGDERPGVFWSYVIDVLAREGVDVSGAGSPAHADRVDLSLLSRLASCLAEATRPVVLVVDAGNRPLGAAWGHDVAYVLRNAGSHLRLVLLARSDPALPLHTLRLAGEVTEVRAAELSFSQDEARTLFALASTPLTDRQTHVLLERTGGWVAGLKFAAMGLSGQPDVERSIADFTGDGGNVAAYLFSEVLETQPANLREVLQVTSVVDELCPGLVEVLTGRPDGQRVLEFLARGNSFVQVLSGSGGCFRYQPLFREFLRAQLAHERPARVPELHRAAARWLAAHGQLSGAVAHAVAAGAWEEAATHVVEGQAVGTLLSCRGGEQPSLLAAMPEDRAGTAGAIVRAALAISELDPERGRTELDRARRSADRDEDRSAAVELSMALLEALCAGLRSEVGSGLTWVGRAERILREELPDAAGSHPELEVLLGLCRARLRLWNGELAGAAATLVGVTTVAEAPGCEALLVTCLGLRALVQAISGRLEQATVLVDQAEAAAAAAGLGGVHRSAPVATARAWIQTERLHLATARESLAEASRTPCGRDDVTDALLSLVRGRLLRAGGDLATARAGLHEAREPRHGRAVSVWLESWLGAAEASLAVAEGTPEQAVRTIDELRQPQRPEPAAALRLAMMASGTPDPGAAATTSSSEQPMSLDCEVTTGLVDAAGHLERGDEERADRTVERCLRLAAPERLRRPFNEVPASLRPVLRRVGGSAAHDRWFSGGSGSPAHPAPATTPTPTERLQSRGLVLEPLTDRELEVLGHLAELLPTEEIAASMFISVNTVRTHVRNILRKLGVTRRNEAVRRAWELGLLGGQDDEVRDSG